MAVQPPGNARRLRGRTGQLGQQRLIVNQPGGYAEIGVYNAASQWYSAVLLLPGLLSVVILPVLSEQFGRQHQVQSKRLLRLAIAANGILVAPVILLGIVTSPWIMASYGRDFADGWPTLIVVLLTAGLVAVHYPVTQVITASGSLWMQMFMHVGWALAFLGLTWLLVSSGALGLAGTERSPISSIPCGISDSPLDCCGNRINQDQSFDELPENAGPVDRGGVAAIFDLAAAQWWAPRKPVETDPAEFLSLEIGSGMTTDTDRRLLYFSPSWSGGLADYAHEQAQALGRLGIEVTILTAPGYQPESSGLYEIRRVMHARHARLGLPRFVHAGSGLLRSTFCETTSIWHVSSGKTIFDTSWRGLTPSIWLRFG